MIVRKCLSSAIAIYCLILSVEFGGVEAERWSRQVSNSEWIPLPDPRTTHVQVEQNGPEASLVASGTAQLPQIPQLALPPALQQQYQDQLLQLQKTQENIQKLLLLQQQLRAQQQLLQSQTFLPSGFGNADEEKRLQQSGLGHQQTDLAPEDLVPPSPATEALPPVFPAQSFLPGQRARAHPPTKHDGLNVPQTFTSLPGQSFKNTQLLQQGHSVGDAEDIRENQRPAGKHLKEPSQGTLSGQVQGGQDEEEEVQLIYVPAETLSQRGQKRGRGRKYPMRQQQQQSHHHHQQPQSHHQHHQGMEAAGPPDAFTRQLLQQIQQEREEKTQFLNEERMKEIARLNEEQRALERKARLQQEAVQREQELQRQRDAEKKKKELEKLEEMAKQRELERIREAREKQRLEELERRRQVEIRMKEEKRRAEETARQREAERLAALERQKELEAQEALKQQRILEKQREEEAATRAANQGLSEHQDVQALPLTRDQQDFHRQHHPETSKPVRSKIRGRHRQRNQYQEQPSYHREPTTTPSPNQPPLSVYMGNSNSKANNARVSDVLKILKDAKTIAVLDTVGPDTPQVFVGPTNLDPPSGYAKFDLPYLSSIDHNRVERKVDKLPFFVAPLSFDPPPGYSKIPFPAPHIGSVVVNTLDNTDPKDGDDQNPSPTPLIEPNSYSDGLDGGLDSTTPLYEPHTTVEYNQEVPNTPKYEQSYSTTSQPGYSGSRFRFRQYYGENKPASVISTGYYEDQRPTTRRHKYYDDNSRSTERPRMEASVGQVEEVSYATTPSFKDGPVGPQDPSTKEQELAAQLALINQELDQQRESQRYNTGQYAQDGSATGLSNSFEGDIGAGEANEVRGPVGPTQYSLPAELPAISPHLPGLVNSLLDKNEGLQTVTTAAPPTTTTITTTTERTPTTTYKPRGRQRNRVSTTKPRTTTPATATTRVNVDRNRRPYNRSRSRFSTTTEAYQESYEPTKSRIPETTLRYSSEHRRPASRTQKYRTRDRTSQQSESPQTQTYDVSHSDAGSPATGTGFLQSTGPETIPHQLDTTSSLSDYSPENYPPSTVGTTETYPTANNHASSLLSEDYARTQNYPQTVPDQYRSGYEQTVEHTGLEKTPVNGFNYQAQNGDPLDQGILQRPKDYQLDGKAENSDFELATTPDPRFKTTEEQRYSSIYDANVPQTQPEYSLTGQDNLHRLESEKIQTSVLGSDQSQQPIFVPLPENKQEDYALPVSSTELPLTEITTESSTTASTTPIVIRQRVRGRIGSRVNHEPSVQTRNRGAQDEYVRFNVVNQDSTRTSSNRQRVRSRTRNQNHGSQVQTDGNEYIKIHAVQQQRQVATTTTTPSTTTTESQPEEDVDYGFIRAPNFRPVHPVDNRFQAPVTYRPQISEVPQQSLLPNDETAVESSPPQTQLLKTRQKYQSAPNRRVSGKSTTLPTTTTPPPTPPIDEVVTTTERIPVATVLPDEAVFPTRTKSRPDDTRQTRIRARVRRPGKKRVQSTTTTESVLESHNELPLDENYPRIRAQPTTTEHQANLFEDNYEESPQFPQNRNPASQQFYETSSENYPSEFVLNFGNYPDQPSQREEYDQTQLASSSPRKYSDGVEGKHAADESSPTTVDIYGAESQWSTKLTRTSFQPSFAVNQVLGEKSKDREWTRTTKDENVPDIITAAPEISSVTLLVSSDDKRQADEAVQDEESMLMGTTDFGRKTGMPDHTEKMNENQAVTYAPTRERIRNDETRKESWLMDSLENSEHRHTAIDLEKTRKKGTDAPAGKKVTRRRRIRVRVKPAVDDFVTAESQHYNSAVNGLIREQYKYNPLREMKLPTPQPILSEKSGFPDFLKEILKSDPPTIKSTTTEVPEVAWTMSPAVTTGSVIPGDSADSTESQMTTIPPTTVKPEDATTTKPLDVGPPQSASSDTKEAEKSWSAEADNNQKKNTGTWNDNWNERSAFDLNFLAAKYKAKENDVKLSNDWEARRVGDEPAARLKSGTDDVVGSSDESVPGKNEEDHGYPKNHRAKWSEVRFPSSFDQPQTRNQESKLGSKSTGTTIPGLVNKKEGDNSVKILTDYVMAIFDTMKSAEEDTTVSEEEMTTTTLQTPLETEGESLAEEKTTTKDPEVATTVLTVLDVDDARTEATQPTETSTYIDPEDATTLERVTATPETATTGSSTEPLATDPPTTTITTTTVAANATDSILGKILRTSTTTRVSHMTEICYRGRCVMTRPSQDERVR